MVWSRIKNAGRPAGWLRHGGRWAAAAGLAVLATGGVALASDAAPSSGPVNACYLPLANPAQLYVVTKGTACPRGWKAVTLNVTGPQGPAGPQGPQGPAGLSTGVTAHVIRPTSLSNSFTTVATGPAVPAGGVYYVNASLTIQAGADAVECVLSPTNATADTEQAVGPAPAGTDLSMSLTGALRIDSGQAPAILCNDPAGNTGAQFLSASLNAVLVSNSS